MNSCHLKIKPSLTNPKENAMLYTGIYFTIAHAKYPKARSYAKVEAVAVDAHIPAQLLRMGFVPKRKGREPPRRSENYLSVVERRAQNPACNGDSDLLQVLSPTRSLFCKTHYISHDLLDTQPVGLYNGSKLVYIRGKLLVTPGDLLAYRYPFFSSGLAFSDGG